MKLTYANITSTLALFMAVATGTSYAATLAANSVTSRSIKDGQVTRADLAPSLRPALSETPEPTQPVGEFGTVMSASGILDDCDFNTNKCSDDVVGNSFKWNYSKTVRVSISGQLEVQDGFYHYDQGNRFPLYLRLDSSSAPNGSNYLNECRVMLPEQKGNVPFTCESTIALTDVDYGTPVHLTLSRPGYLSNQNISLHWVVNGDVKIEVAK